MWGRKGGIADGLACPFPFIGYAVLEPSPEVCQWYPFDPDPVACANGGSLSSGNGSGGGGNGFLVYLNVEISLRSFSISDSYSAS